MAWDGIERRTQAESFIGLERRAAARARVLAQATRLVDTEVRELAHRRQREELERLESAEYME